MKILVVGLGSMGKRRIRNLQYLNNEVLGFDLREDRREFAAQEYGINTFDTFSDAISQNPEALIISVPSNMHHYYAMQSIQMGKHFFTESNFLPDGMDDLVQAEKSGLIKCAPSFSMSFNHQIELLKSFVDNREVGSILCFSYHLGAYLPNWHPFEDYRQVYFSKRETGGAKEMVAFELTWLTWIFGSITAVFASKGKISDLDVDIDDVYLVLIEFESGIKGNMLVDVLSRSEVRQIELVGEDGHIKWDTRAGTLQLFDSGSSTWTDRSCDAVLPPADYPQGLFDWMYVREMQAFLDFIEGRAVYPYSFEKERQIVRILAAIEQSASEGLRIQIEN